MLRIWPIEIFDDNYVWVLQRDGSPKIAVVDPGDGLPVLRAVEERGLEIAAVLITHHHHDHIGGLEDIIHRSRPEVWGPSGDAIRGVDQGIGQGESVTLPFLEVDLDVVGLPGHTRHHIGYLAPGFALVGDTLFAGGCGRVFEGTMEQMHDSLCRLASLPPNTEIYCAHEYTVSNLRFAHSVEPDNAAVRRRLTEARAARAGGSPTVPSMLAEELETNPFLRSDHAGLVEAAIEHSGRTLSPGAETFAVLRAWKDGWTG
jgi:hydroxyacylglutathione hydrolase